MTLKSFAEFSESSYVPAERVKVMDQYGILAQVQYPNALGLGGGKIMKVADERLRLFCVRAYNDACAEIQAESGSRLFPQALLPIWDVDAALVELDRARAMGLTGCVLTDKPQDWGLPALNDGYWDPLWDTLQGLDLPVNFHVGGGSDDADYGVWGGTSFQQQIATLSIILFMNNVKIMLNCMFSGLLDRFPRLKFVSVESGVGWVPFVLEAAEYQFDQWFVDRKPIKRRPREYFRDNFYCSWWFETDDLLRNIALIGEDNVMFETDFPHPTCLYPDVHGPLARALAGAGEDLTRKLVYENARRVYQLPLDPL
jgi:predicted TIM-barrel fold metal-dependent hydrolase